MFVILDFLCISIFLSLCLVFKIVFSTFCSFSVSQSSLLTNHVWRKMCSHLLVVQFTEQLTSLSFSFTSKINVFSHKTLVHFFHFSDCSYVWQGGLSLLKAATFQVLKNISDCSFWTKANCSKQSKEHVILPLQYTMSCKLFLPTTKTIMLLAAK